MIGNDAQGIIIADNAISAKPIDDSDLRSLELFASQAALAVERSRLYLEREDRLRELEEANRKIRDNHEIMLRNERLAAVGQVAAQVAHEIRNPLVAIGGFARALIREFDEGDTGKEFASMIAGETTRLEEVLSQVLSFSRPNPSAREEIDLVHVVRRTSGMMQVEFAERNIRPVLTLPGRPVTVRADGD